MADGGVKMGLSRQVALTLAAQTVAGAAEMFLATRQHPALVRDEIVSPAGTTAHANHALEKGGFRNTVINAGFVVKVIDDGGVFFVELNPAFGSQLFDGLADVGGAGDEDVSPAVDETRDRGDVQLPAEALHRRREDDEVIVQKLAVFD